MRVCYPQSLCVIFQMQDCLEEPTHGYDGEAATFCEAHMAVGMKVNHEETRLFL